MWPYLEGGEGIGGDVEGAHLHVGEEAGEVVRVEQHLGQRLVADTLPQHDATVQGHGGGLIAGGGERETLRQRKTEGERDRERRDREERKEREGRRETERERERERQRERERERQALTL